MLIDKFGRQISYLRLAVTDRCNLRCFYCMPEEGITYIDRKELLSYEELYRLIHILVPQGVDKVRITGGEPFLRKDMMPFLELLSKESGIKKINLTTNGVLTKAYLPDLLKMGIDTINFSLDTIDRERFKQITNRDEYDRVWESIEASLALGIKTKINTVVMHGKNIADIIPLARLSIKHNIAIRYIEEMPFNGGNHDYSKLNWDHKKILSHLKSEFPELQPIKAPANSTASLYKIPGSKGHIGIIAAYTRSFCGSCNRLRITPQGIIKTCLYDQGIFNIKDLMRAGASDDQILLAIKQAVTHKAKDGFEAEKNRSSLGPFAESMATIGG